MPRDVSKIVPCLFSNNLKPLKPFLRSNKNQPSIEELFNFSQKCSNYIKLVNLIKGSYNFYQLFFEGTLSEAKNNGAHIVFFC